jgi:hypothetical protein
MCEESQEQNLKVALGVTPLTLGSRNDIRGALKAIDDLLHAIEHHFAEGCSD